MSAPVASSNNGRFAHVGVLALTVAVFAVVVIVVTLQLRADLQEQLLRREAQKLADVTSMQLDIRAEDLAKTTLALAELPAALLVAVMKTARLPGVVGVRVFNAERHYAGALPFTWSQEPPSAADWERLSTRQAFARLHPDLVSEEIVGMPLIGEPEPAIEAWVPLRQTGSPKLIGAAQFWIRGGALNDDMSKHDQRLRLQAASAWLMGSIVIAIGLSWAFRRLAAANSALRERSEDLQRANRELVLAAKTSALGAVTAHLMHELKNPLAGLELFVAGQSEAGAGQRGDAGGELAAASELTRRLRTMVNDVVGVLRDEQSGAKFELTGADMAEVLVGKVQRDADERGVKLEAYAPANLALSGRRANLATLVLRNLLQNALEATPAGGTVRLTGRAAAAGALEFLVEDGGAGLPATVRTRLFQPCASTKVGGSGLGLALSHHLAQQAGGRLELVRSDERGTSFRLVLAAEA